MNSTQAAQIVGFMEKYSKHFVDTVSFLNKKQMKILADDLIWLHDSLQEEQKLVMYGSSLETERLKILAAAGKED